MKSVQVSKTIQAAPEPVFDVFADLRNAGDRITDIISIEVLGDAPIGVGTKWRETRKVFGKEHTEEMEIMAFNRPEGYKVEAESSGSHYRTEFSFEPEGDGTKVTMTFGAVPLTLFAKIISFFMGPMMRKTLAQCMERDMDDLKSYLESNKAPAAQNT